jgi:hypothetical protein
MGGALIEGTIISEAVKVFAGRGLRPDLYFWRSHDGLEVGLIIQAGGKYYPMEIKLTATPTLQHLEALNKFKTLAGADAAMTGILICRVPKKRTLPHNNIAMPWHQFPGWLDKLLGRIKE